MRTIQRVLNLLKNINPLLRRYVICLILSRGRKNCASMAHLVGVPKKKLYSFLSVAEMASKEISQHLLEYIYDTRTDNTLRALAIDPTHIIKLYAQKIQKLCCDRAGCTKHIERCMVPVCAMITDKYRTIPIDFKFWLQEKVIGEKLYKSKAMIAQELINEAKNKGIHFDFVVFDGAFAVPAMFDYFEETKDLFIMRIPRNRKITTADGVCAQLKNHPALKLHRNSREKTVKAEYKGRTYFFTAQKRKKRDGSKETVFLISNMDLPAKKQIAAYDLRWPLEKVIRTTKQKFGATQCQALESEKQYAHIMAGFLAHTILDIANNDKESQSVDELVNIIRDYHSNELITLNKNLKQKRVTVTSTQSQNSFKIFPNFIKTFRSNQVMRM